MSYFRLQPSGNISVVHEAELIPELLGKIGVILVVCYDSQSATYLAKEFHKVLPEATYRKHDKMLEDSLSKFLFRSDADFRNYQGLQLTTAYVHRKHTGDLMCKLMTRVKEYPQ